MELQVFLSLWSKTSLRSLTTSKRMKTLVPALRVPPSQLKETQRIPFLAGNHAEAEGFVPRAAKLARPVTARELTFLPQLQRSHDRLNETLQRTLPLEVTLRKGIQQRLDQIRPQLARLTHGPEIGLPTLNPAFLGWTTDEDWFPAFSIYSLDSDVCTITLERGSPFDAFRTSSQPNYTVSPKLPACMQRHYLSDQVKASLQATAEEENLRKVELAARYDGVMPDWVREKIHAYLKPGIAEVHFEQIFIIAEAPAWQVNKTAAIPVGDPLVVGVAHQNLWLIAAYDLTAVEQKVRALFTGQEQIPLN
jgi:hypothetical protein